MTNLKQLTDALRQAVEPEIMQRPDEVDLRLPKADFVAKMLREKDGAALLDLLAAGEYRIAERLGLIDGQFTEVGIFMAVPSWNALVAHLMAVNLVEE